MNLRSTTKYFLSLASLSLILVGLFSQPTHAATKIKKSQAKEVASFDYKHGTQGGIITKDYYVFLDTKGHGSSGSLLKIVDRGSCKLVKTITLKTKRLSGIYNKWGSDYVTLINYGSQVGCVKLNGESSSYPASGCPTPAGLGYVCEGTGQGAVAVAKTGYRFKVCGYTGGKIGVFPSNSKTPVAEFEPPHSLEPEGVSIDEKTGEVYVAYAGGGKLKYYKFNSSLFSKYTGKSGTSNPTICKNTSASGGSSSSSSGSIYSDKPYDPTANGLAVRDETFKPEVTESTYDGTVDTTFFGTIQDDKEGCGVYTVLQFIIDLLTIGIGVAAVLGIVISGILYLTARGNVAQTTKAKRRIYEIVMGLVAYVALYAITSFLLPTINPEFKTCHQMTEEEIAARDAAREAKIEAARKANENKVTTTPAKDKSSSTKKSKPTTNKQAREQIAATAREFANSKKKYLAAFKSTGVKAQIKKDHDSKGYGNECNVRGESCGAFVSTVLVASGVDTNSIKKKNYADNIKNYMLNHPKKWERISKPEAGAVALKQYCSGGSCHWHVYIYLNSKGSAAEGDNCNSYGRIVRQSNPNYIFRYIGIK